MHKPSSHYTICNGKFPNVDFSDVESLSVLHSLSLSPSSLPPSAGALAIPRAFFGSGFGRIHLDDLNCVGTEDALINCSHNGIREHNCGHSEDAGAICIGQ